MLNAYEAGKNSHKQRNNCASLIFRFGTSVHQVKLVLALAVMVYCANSFSAQDFVATSCRSREYSSAKTSNSLP